MQNKNERLFGKINVVKYLISLGVDDWNNGLSYACSGLNKIKCQPEQNYIDIMKLMIEKGAIYCYSCSRSPNEHV
jgi:hypothetical protein